MKILDAAEPSGPLRFGDLDRDLDVDELDLRRFALEWLYECPYDWPLR